MPAGRSWGGLLLRGSLLLTGMLIFWWLALQTPMLAMLRLSEDVSLRLLGSDSEDPISVEPSGDWTFRVPVDAPQEAKPGPDRTTRIASIEFSMSRSDLVLFTFSLPVYCAIVLAVPISRSSLRALICGAGIVGLVEVLSMLGFIEISAHSVVAQMQTASASVGHWPREFGNYLLTQVVPFAAPVLIALTSHRELRSRIFPSGLSEPAACGSKIAADGLRARKPRQKRNRDDRRHDSSSD